MKNIVIIAPNDIYQPPSPTLTGKQHLTKTIDYFNLLIQKTLLSLQKYKQLDIIGANDLNSSTQQLEQLYFKLENNNLLLKNKQNFTKIKSNLDIIRDDISSIFKNYGTENIRDVLNLSFSDEYINTSTWDKEKYKLIEKYFHPINFKNIKWKNDNKTQNNKPIDKNKIVEDFIIVDNASNRDAVE